MARKSTVTRLPDDVRDFIEQQLAAGRLTLDELISELQQRFPLEAASKTLPSRSAVHRYGQKLERRLAAIRASTEAAKLIAESTGDDKDARSEALTALVQTELFDAILALKEADDADPEERVQRLAAAARHIATLTRSSINLKEFQAKAGEAARQKLLAEQREKLDALGRAGDVPADVLQKVIRAAYDL